MICSRSVHYGLLHPRRLEGAYRALGNGCAPTSGAGVMPGKRMRKQGHLRPARLVVAVLFETLGRSHHGGEIPVLLPGLHEDIGFQSARRGDRKHGYIHRGCDASSTPTQRKSLEELPRPPPRVTADAISAPLPIFYRKKSADRADWLPRLKECARSHAGAGRH